MNIYIILNNYISFIFDIFEYIYIYIFFMNNEELLLQVIEWFLNSKFRCIMASGFFELVVPISGLWANDVMRQKAFLSHTHRCQIESNWWIMNRIIGAETHLWLLVFVSVLLLAMSPLSQCSSDDETRNACFPKVYIIFLRSLTHFASKNRDKNQ